MLKKYLSKIKNTPLAKKYLEPLLLNLLEEEFQYDKTVNGKFTNSSGKEYLLHKGLRDRIKPGWQSMFDPAKRNRIPSLSELKIELISAKRHIKNFKSILNSYNHNLKNKSILEIGCYNGLKTTLLALEDCSNIIGSDVTFYYTEQGNEKETVVDSHLSTIRKEITNLFSDREKDLLRTKLKYVEDDITKSELPANHFDIVTSWETLEHINNIEEAFKQIHRILKPGGIAFHEYNPFFSLNGGHSLCTLDFPWGHCRLSNQDFDRYVKDIRPQEYSAANGFYTNSLNRMTMKDLKIASEKANLKTLAIIPFVKKSHLSLFSEDAMRDTFSLYPNAEPMDLISPVVWVLHQKE